MQALDVLAEEYEVCEETMKKVTYETEEGDRLFAVAYEAMEELDKAQKDQDRLQDEMEVTCESMVAASKEHTNCWANFLNGAFREVNKCRVLHVETGADLKKACQGTAELKRKGTDVHVKTRSHRERCRRATKDHTRSEAAVNHSLGCLGWYVNETAAATHALTCGVPDRESNEIKYLREATELIDESQKQLQGVPPVSLHASEHGEVMLTERRR